MTRTDFNPFQASGLRLPTDLKPQIDSLVQRRTGLEIEASPFSRTVDFWFLAACVTIADGKAKPTGDGAKGWKFNEGSVLRDSRTRIEIMELAGIAVLGDLDVLKTPEVVASLFNDSAALGAPRLLKAAEAGKETALRNLIKELAKRTKPKPA